MYYILLILMCIFVVGCVDSNSLKSQERLQKNLVDALNKVTQYEYGTINADVNVQVEFNNNSLSEDQLKQIDLFKNFYVKSKYYFDAMNNYQWEITPLISASGYRTTIYNVDDRYFLKVPIYNQYIDLTDPNSLDIGILDTEMNIQIHDIIHEIQNLKISKYKNMYFDLIKSNNIIKNKERILTTDGNVNAIVYQQEIDFYDIINNIKNQGSEDFSIEKSIVDSIDTDKIRDEWDISATVSTFIVKDEKLIKQKIDIHGVNKSTAFDSYNEINLIGGRSIILTIPVLTFEISVLIDYSGLGFQQDIVLPQISKDNLMDNETLNRFLEKLLE